MRCVLLLQLMIRLTYGYDPRAPNDWGPYDPRRPQRDAGPPPPPPPPPGHTGEWNSYEYQEQTQYEARPRDNKDSATSKEERSRPSRLKARAAGAMTSGVVAIGISKTVSGSVRPRWALWGVMANAMMQTAGGRFGELAHATGMTTIESSRRLRELSRSGAYPIFKQFKSALGLAPRRRFPPESDDPWRYTGNLPPFSMFRCLIGAICLSGATVAFIPLPPLVPTSLVAIAAAIFAIFSVTLRDARGDAARCLVARVVAMISIILASANQAHLGSAAAAALRLSGDRLSNFDKRYGISRRLAIAIARISSGAAQQTRPPPSTRNPAEPPYYQQEQWPPGGPSAQDSLRGASSYRQQQYGNSPYYQAGAYTASGHPPPPPEHDWM